MKKQNLSILFFVFSFISLVISIYQFVDARILDGILSLIFSTVFFIGGIHNENYSVMPPISCSKKDEKKLN